MASKAKPLNDELKRRFYPYVKSRGFVKKRSTDAHFAEFIRKTDSGEDVFDIQWDKYWRPYFVLNFKKVGTVEKHWSYRGRLQRKRGGQLSCWFSLSPPFLEKILNFRWQYSTTEVVLELLEAFQELEQWWSTGEIGPHIYIMEIHA
jgi:hypothetical protein